MAEIGKRSRLSPAQLWALRALGCSGAAARDSCYDAVIERRKKDRRPTAESCGIILVTEFAFLLKDV
ncbi:MAG: hypothetical protein ACJ8KA_05645, partial [Sulfurifustis sp.]